MNRNLSLNSRIRTTVALLALLPFVAGLCFAGEKEDLVSRRDAYTYVLCYYEDALDYAIENLQSEDINSRKFAMDVTERIINLRLRGDTPSKEVRLFAAFQNTDASHHLKFESAIAQARRGSTSGVGVLFDEFRTRKLPHDSRQHALRFICQRDHYYPEMRISPWAEEPFLDPKVIQPYKTLLEQALEDEQSVAALAAAALCHIGNAKGKQWLLERIPKTPRSFPARDVLASIHAANLKEAVVPLKAWLSSSGFEDKQTGASAEQIPVIMTLAALGDRDMIAPLIIILSSFEKNSFGLTGEAALSLARFGDKSVIAKLKEAVRTRVRKDRLDVIEALLLLNDPSAVQELQLDIKKDDGWSAKSVDLAIEYKIAEVLPDLQQRFSQKNQRDFFDAKVPKDAATLAYLKQMGITREAYVSNLYSQTFSECDRIALGVCQLNSAIGQEYVFALLERSKTEEVPYQSICCLVTAAEDHKRGTALSYLLPLLDNPDPMRRKAASDCLRRLTRQKLTPKREPWEKWIRDNVKQ